MSNKHNNNGNSGNSGKPAENQQNESKEQKDFQKSIVPMITIQDVNGTPVSISLETWQALQQNISEKHRSVPESTSPTVGITMVESQYSPEDHLEEPVVFFSMRTSFTDYGAKDHRTGTYHLPPLMREIYTNGVKEMRPEPIHFRFSHVGEVLEGRNISKIKYCTYICRNKKVLDYLLNHPLLGVEFFRVTDKITTTDGIKARALADAHVEVSAMGNDIVLERLSAKKATISQDMQANRNNLTSLLAEDRLTAQDKAILDTANLVGGKGNIVDVREGFATETDRKKMEAMSAVANRQDMFSRQSD